MKKLDMTMERLTTVFKWLYLIHILFAGNSVIYDTPIEKLTSILVLGLGAVVVLWRFINAKNYVKYPFIKLYAIFAAAFALTLLVNFRYGWIANAKVLIWMTLQFTRALRQLISLQKRYTTVRILPLGSQQCLMVKASKTLR